jgi:hypothetical protein
LVHQPWVSPKRFVKDKLQAGIKSTLRSEKTELLAIPGIDGDERSGKGCTACEPVRLKRIIGDSAVRNHVPLELLTAEQLRERAREYREMAETATSDATSEGLVRLAEEFEALAVTQQSRAAAG